MKMRPVSVAVLAFAGLLGAAATAIPASAQIFGAPAQAAAPSEDDSDVIVPGREGTAIQSQSLPPVSGAPAPQTYSAPPPGPGPSYSAAPPAAPVELSAPGGAAPMPGPAGPPEATANAYPGSRSYPDGYSSGGPRPPGEIDNVTASAAPGGGLPPDAQSGTPIPGNAQPGPNGTIAGLPPEDQPETGQPKELPPNLRRQTVEYFTKEPPGTIIIDTPNTYLYLVLGHNLAMRYGIGVGREGFTWAGREKVSRMAEWPDWYPPTEMIERQPYLPRFMAGGESNPLGARALYIGNTLYRIHGTNQPSTIGTFVSSGCIRLTNADIEDLYTRVKVGTKIVVLPGKPPATASNTAAGAAPARTQAH